MARRKTPAVVPALYDATNNRLAREAKREADQFAASRIQGYAPAGYSNAQTKTLHGSAPHYYEGNVHVGKSWLRKNRADIRSVVAHEVGHHVAEQLGAKSPVELDMMKASKAPDGWGDYRRHEHFADGFAGAVHGSSAAKILPKYGAEYGAQGTSAQRSSAVGVGVRGGLSAVVDKFLPEQRDNTPSHRRGFFDRLRGKQRDYQSAATFQRTYTTGPKAGTTETVRKAK